jgi:3-oxosteroid 1-dehydrogenase
MKVLVGFDQLHDWERGDDVVVVAGAGLSGIALALAVSLSGRPVVILEASEKIGGASAFSGGQVWVGANHRAEAAGFDDDLEKVERYIRAISAQDPDALDPVAMLRWISQAPTAARFWEQIGAVEWETIPRLADYHADAAGATSGGRYLTSVPVPSASLGVLAETLRTSPYFPVGLTYEQMLQRGRRRSMLDRHGLAPDTPAFGNPGGDFSDHQDTALLTFGPAVVGSFLRRLVGQANVVIRLQTRVTRLLSAGDAVVGAVAETRGQEHEWRGPVVLATSTFDWNPDLVREFHGFEPEDFGSVAPKTLRGDAITLARSVGGATASIPVTSVPMKPGWVANNETGFAYGAEYAMPHSIIVNRKGERFCDDSYWVDIIAKVASPDSDHRPFFMVWDSRHHEKYGLGATEPGGAYPVGVVESSDSLGELADLLSVDARSLQATVESFNQHARDGSDPDFGRGTVPYVRAFVGDPDHTPNPVLGPIDQPPYFGMRLRLVSTGIGSSGVRTDGDGRVYREDGSIIDGLFAVGSCSALTTSGGGYNSGFALGRGLTQSYLAAEIIAPGSTST